MFTTTTTKDVKFHEFVLPAGSTIRVYEMWTEMDYRTVSAYVDNEGQQWSVSVPFDAVPADVRAKLPRHYA